MSNKKPVNLSLTAALAALSGLSVSDTAVAAVQSTESTKVNSPADVNAAGQQAEPNAFFRMGDDLLNFIVTQAADGTIIAQHRSTHLRYRTRCIAHTIPAGSRRMRPILPLSFKSRRRTQRSRQSAAYRLIGTAHCDIAKSDTRWICKITARNDLPKGISIDATCYEKFLNLITDENVRQSVNKKTEGVET